MSFFSFLSFFFLISYCVVPAHLLSQFPIILIVSYDAFRYDYLSEGFNPTAVKLRNEGTYAEYMNNVFVTKTFPNHHSIATGVYPEVHGVLGNSLYDSFYKKQLNYSYEFWHYSKEVLPIWIANEKKGEGRHSGIMMWPGNEYEYSGIKPTYQRAWSYNVTWDKRVDGAISWILNPEKPANLVLLYIEQPDYYSHCFGSDSPRLKEELKLIDNVTKYILDKLKENNLTSHVNLFLLADHGMLSVTKKDVIDLRKIVSDDLYDRYEGSPALHIYPKAGKASEVYGALKKAVSDGAPFNVYKKADIPDRWHFKNNRRTPPIFVVADPPHVFQDFYPYIEHIQKTFNFTADDDTPFGVHGYDNKVQSMKPYFIAVGPDIKQNFKIEPFETVDLFSLWAHMSGFPEYAFQTNGSFLIVSQMLRGSADDSYNYLISQFVLSCGMVRPECVSTARRFYPTGNGNKTDFGGILLGVLLLGGITLALTYFFRRKFRSRRKPFSRRFGTESAESCQRLLDGEEDT